jgi:hypothetical protein
MRGEVIVVDARGDVIALWRALLRGTSKEGEAHPPEDMQPSRDGKS